MKHKFRFFLLITFTIFSFVANAAQNPRFLGTEKKFRSYIYNPNEVYRYVGHYTYQGFIEFEEGELISTITMGDPTLWLFDHIGNRLFLKPVGEDNSETNMTVITNRKIYHFELMAKEASGINDEDLIFVAKFIYPNQKEKNIVQFPPKPKSDLPDMRDLSIYNFNYQYTGERGIAPLKVFDDGEFTYFQFSKKNAEIPAIFSVDADGFESLVNFRAVENYIVVERVVAQYTLRNGNDIVCVYNSNMYRNGLSRPESIAPTISNNNLTSPYGMVVPPSTPPLVAQPAISPAPVSNPAVIQGGGIPQGFPQGGGYSQGIAPTQPIQQGFPQSGGFPQGSAPQSVPTGFPQDSSQGFAPPISAGDDPYNYAPGGYPGLPTSDSLQ